MLFCIDNCVKGKLSSKTQLQRFVMIVGIMPSRKNGMLHHSLGGEVIFFFAALYCSCLGFNALLASPRYKALQ